MGTFIILLLAMLTYANPILLTIVFAKRVAAQTEAPRWRSAAFWLALSFALLAALTFWISIPYAPAAASANEIQHRLLAQASILSSALAFIFTLAAKGKGRTWVALSAFITPLSWFWALFMQ